MEKRIGDLIGKSGGKDSTYFAILSAADVGETSYYPALDDDGNELMWSDVDPDEYMRRKTERKRRTIRLTVSGKAVSAEGYVKAAGMMAAAISPTAVDVYPDEPYTAGDYLAEIGQRGGRVRTPAKASASRKNGARGGRYARIRNAQDIHQLLAELKTGKYDGVENIASHLPSWGEQPDVDDRDDVYSWDNEYLLVADDGRWALEERGVEPRSLPG